MSEDPILEDIHRARNLLLKESDGDLGKLMERLKAAEMRERERVISREKLQSDRREGPKDN